MTVGVSLFLFLSLLFAISLAQHNVSLTPKNPSDPKSKVNHQKKPLNLKNDEALAPGKASPQHKAAAVPQKDDDDDLLLMMSEGQTLLDKMSVELKREKWSENSIEMFTLLNSIKEFGCKFLTNDRATNVIGIQAQQILEFCGGKQGKGSSIETLQKLDKELAKAKAEMKKTETTVKLTIDGVYGTLAEILPKAKQHPKSIRLQTYDKALDVLKIISEKIEQGTTKKVMEKMMNKKTDSVTIMPSELVGLMKEILTIILQKIDYPKQKESMNHILKTRKTTQKKNPALSAAQKQPNFPAANKKQSLRRVPKSVYPLPVQNRIRRTIPWRDDSQFHFAVLSVLSVCASCAIAMCAIENGSTSLGSVAIVAIAHLFLFRLSGQRMNIRNTGQNVPEINHDNIYHQNQSGMPIFQNRGNEGFARHTGEEPLLSRRQAPISEYNYRNEMGVHGDAVAQHPQENPVQTDSAPFPNYESHSRVFRGMPSFQNIGNESFARHTGEEPLLSRRQAPFRDYRNEMGMHGDAVAQHPQENPVQTDSALFPNYESHGRVFRGMRNRNGNNGAWTTHSRQQRAYTNESKCEHCIHSITTDSNSSSANSPNKTTRKSSSNGKSNCAKTKSVNSATSSDKKTNGKECEWHRNNCNSSSSETSSDKLKSGKECEWHQNNSNASINETSSDNKVKMGKECKLHLNESMNRSSVNSSEPSVAKSTCLFVASTSQEKEDDDEEERCSDERKDNPANFIVAKHKQSDDEESNDVDEYDRDGVHDDDAYRGDRADNGQNDRQDIDSDK